MAITLGLAVLIWNLSTLAARPAATAHSPLRLDINTATWPEWLNVEGVGDTLARRIVENRNTHGPFESVDDLARVNGIGLKSVETMRPYLRGPDLPITSLPLTDQ